MIFRRPQGPRTPLDLWIDDQDDEVLRRLDAAVATSVQKDGHDVVQQLAGVEILMPTAVGHELDRRVLELRRFLRDVPEGTEWTQFRIRMQNDE